MYLCNNSLKMSGFRLDKNVSISQYWESFTITKISDEHHTDNDPERTRPINHP